MDGPNSSGIWGFADSLVSGYWNHDPGYQDAAQASFWDPPEAIDYFGSQFMMQSEFISSAMEGLIDTEAEVAEVEAGLRDSVRGLLEAAQQLPQLTQAMGSIVGHLGEQNFDLPIPAGVPPITDEQVGWLAVALADAASEYWANASLTDSEGALVDEFAWMPLKQSTIDQKKRQGLTEEEARKPNFRTGDMARQLQTQAFGGPELDETPKGMRINFGPPLANLSSRDRLKWQESQFGAGGNAPFSPAGRGHMSFRTPRAYTFTPGMRAAMQDVMNDWITRVDIQQRAIYGDNPAWYPDRVTFF